jgi:3-dehydroquinate synthase
MEFFGFDLQLNLKNAGFDCDFITVPVGEAAKSLNEFSRIISQMIDMRCDRSTTILALGGGVVGDIAGFVASSFMRGIKYYQIPTTLLAMVDSSIGGKTGINTAEGKNMVGSIYQPKGVLVDPDLLNTLPREEVISGLGEIIKYGAIWDADFLNNISIWLDDLNSFPLDKAVEKSCTIKADIVSKDERENGLRQLLNFGHTIGHALEAHLGYGRIRHGEGVALGMKCAGWISSQLGILDKNQFQNLTTTIDKLTLPKLPHMDPNTILSFVKNDKKIRNGILHFIVLDQLGKGNICETVSDDLIINSLKVIQ